MLSFQGGVRVPSYTASKSGVMGITRLLANEWAAHGINVNAIAPGLQLRRRGGGGFGGCDCHRRAIRGAARHPGIA